MGAATLEVICELNFIWNSSSRTWKYVRIVLRRFYEEWKGIVLNRVRILIFQHYQWLEITPISINSLLTGFLFKRPNLRNLHPPFLLETIWRLLLYLMRFPAFLNLVNRARLWKSLLHSLQPLSLLFRNFPCRNFLQSPVLNLNLSLNSTLLFHHCHRQQHLECSFPPLHPLNPIPPPPYPKPVEHRFLRPPFVKE